MKKMAVMLVLCGLAASAAAQEWTTTVDLSYTCKYMWRGFDILDNAGAFQPSIDFAHESGFGANVWMSYPERGGTTDALDSLATSRVNLTEYDYTLYYGGTAWEGACWETDYTVGWRYYDFIDTGSEDADLQEVFIEAEMPMLTGNAIVPHVAVYHLWQARSGGDIGLKTGQIYVVGFNYLLPTEEQMPDLPLTFSWDIVYNDGFGSAHYRPDPTLSTDVDNDWSHMVWGLRTEMTCPMTGAKIVPAVYFQNSFDDSVNTQDEFWGALSYQLTF